MKSSEIINTNDGYLKNIQKIWDVKEKIFQKTKNMNFNQYVHFMEKDISDIKNRLKINMREGKINRKRIIYWIVNWKCPQRQITSAKRVKHPNADALLLA